MNQSLLFKIRALAGLLIVVLGCSFTAAPVLAGNISEIPRGAVFKLRHELEVPANQDFLMLGKRDRKSVV